MENKITLQGHDFFINEDGVYETPDKFILDTDDWLFGDYPDMAMLYVSVSGGMQPLLLSNDSNKNSMLIDMACDKGDDYGVSFHDDLNKLEVGGLF